MNKEAKLGAVVEGDHTRFSLFSCSAVRCSLRVFDDAGRPAREQELDALGGGYFSGRLPGAGHGTRYKFVLDGRELTDPYARFLPDGVHDAAMVVEPSYRFEHRRPAPRPLSEHVLYELHVGAFTPEGTYAAAAQKLRHLVDLGVTLLELMPLSSFPGTRGWGYDGVAHFAPFAPYGEPDSLRRFIDQAHGVGLGVILDVVYNHFGPSGNYLGAYSPRYFTREYQNAWGEAPHFSEPPMRHYVVDNALYWLEEFQFDGLRLDAVHAIFDPSPVHVIRELADAVRAHFPRALLFAEDERNDPGDVDQLGCNAIWADDFHHQLRVTLTGERDGYYAGYEPGVAGLARVIERGWLYEGQHSVSTGRVRGHAADRLPADAFVYCIQNHDQIGNRALGTRLCHDAEIDAYCLASVLLLFLPMTPLIFMGQEWAASTPFLFFTDHEPELGALVTAGRHREFAHFAAFSSERDKLSIPDPQARETFERSQLRWDELTREPHARVLDLYRELLRLRRTDLVLARGSARAELSVRAEGALLAVRRSTANGRGTRLLLANFGTRDLPIAGAPWLEEPNRVVFSLGASTPGWLAPQGAIIVATGSGEPTRA
jgi:maltooligosyltrehalose trehalohydrolase